MRGVRSCSSLPPSAPRCLSSSLSFFPFFLPFSFSFFFVFFFFFLSPFFSLFFFSLFLFFFFFFFFFLFPLTSADFVIALGQESGSETGCPPAQDVTSELPGRPASTVNLPDCSQRKHFPLYASPCSLPLPLPSPLPPAPCPLPRFWQFPVLLCPHPLCACCFSSLPPPLPPSARRTRSDILRSDTFCM